MPDMVTSRLQQEIDRVFEERERHLEEQRRRQESAERARCDHAVRFRALTDSVIRPVMVNAGARLRELGHDYDITDHGLVDGDTFAENQQIRFGLSLGGRGEDAFVHAGEASLTFATSVEERTVEARLRVLGRDRSGMSPYRISHDDTLVLAPSQVTTAAVEDLLVRFLSAAVESTYADGQDDG